jgi:hypothetical protein
MDRALTTTVALLSGRAEFSLFGRFGHPQRWFGEFPDELLGLRTEFMLDCVQILDPFSEPKVANAMWDGSLDFPPPLTGRHPDEEEAEPEQEGEEFDDEEDLDEDFDDEDEEDFDDEDFDDEEDEDIDEDIDEEIDDIDVEEDEDAEFDDDDDLDEDFDDDEEEADEVEP